MLTRRNALAAGAALFLATTKLGATEEHKAQEWSTPKEHSCVSDCTPRFAIGLANLEQEEKTMTAQIESVIMDDVTVVHQVHSRAEIASQTLQRSVQKYAKQGAKIMAVGISDNGRCWSIVIDGVRCR